MLPKQRTGPLSLYRFRGHRVRVFLQLEGFDGETQSRREFSRSSGHAIDRGMSVPGVKPGGCRASRGAYFSIVTVSKYGTFSGERQKPDT